MAATAELYGNFVPPCQSVTTAPAPRTTGNTGKMSQGESTASVIISANPQILILEKKASDSEDALLARYRKDGVWRATDAVKNSRIYFIDSDLISIPGPRMADAIAELARIGFEANKQARP